MNTKETISNLAKRVSEVSLRASIGEIIIQSMQETVGLERPEVGVIAQPTSPWAKKVDSIEVPFASEYDFEEYEANPALALMGLYELRLMLSLFGVPALEQINYKKKPLEGKRFLNVGTGTGREVVALSALGGEVIGIDATRKYLDITAEKVQAAASALNRELPVKLYQCPAEDYDYSQDEYDGITSLFGVLNHVEKWQEVVGKMVFALRPGSFLVLSMYGSNEALVFKLLREGKLTYKPSILQRRAVGGILLGESEDVLPANFPAMAEVTQVIADSGLLVTKTAGFLGIASLFPQNPQPDSLLAYKQLVREIDADAADFLENFGTADEILLAAFLYDRRNTSLEDCAYFAITARKEVI